MTQERESMELDVLFVGAGPANLTAAYKLMRNVQEYNEKAEAEGKEPLEDPMVMVIDKGANLGNHSLSGAVLDPVMFAELFPEENLSSLPFARPVKSDQIYYLTATGQIALPGFLVPPDMHNDGSKYIVSLSEMTRWLAKKCEDMGVEVMTEFAAAQLLRDGQMVRGAIMGDKGLEKNGEPGHNFALGEELQAKVTVLGEGTRGYLAQELIEGWNLAANANPQVWGLGIKELIEVPAGRLPKGSVIHTFGYPLDFSTYGGSFIYALEDNLIAIGLVMGLDYPNPLAETHGLFLQLKKHPFVASLIAGGKVVEYGAKTLPEGGYFSLPQLAVDGAVLVGDSAGFLNTMRLKGLHLAMKSGALAADKICAALASDDFSAAALDYRTDFEASWAGEEMRKVRNFRQGFHDGMIPGMLLTGVHMATGGALPGGRKKMPADFEGLRPAASGKATAKTPTDETLYLDLLTDVYKSGSIHREEQPAHCKILDPAKCRECFQRFAAPCTRFCPAKVYEENLGANGQFEGIQVNFSNCVHCKTCEIKDPLRNIRWTPPEGGDGPKFQKM